MLNGGYSTCGGANPKGTTLHQIEKIVKIIFFCHRFTSAFLELINNYLTELLKGLFIQ